MKTPPHNLKEFDIASFLEDDATIVSYLNAALEDGDQAFLLTALGDIARARGMSQVSAHSGLSRESLYKTLRPNARPRFDTINRVFQALDIQLVAVSKGKSAQL